MKGPVNLRHSHECPGDRITTTLERLLTYERPEQEAIGNPRVAGNAASPCDGPNASERDDVLARDATGSNQPVQQRLRRHQLVDYRTGVSFDDVEITIARFAQGSHYVKARATHADDTASESVTGRSG